MQNTCGNQQIMNISADAMRTLAKRRRECNVEVRGNGIPGAAGPRAP